jgi:hypothetical protein
MNRHAKKVKVVHRWRPEDDGEIPLKEEEPEMLGSAIGAMNTLGEAKASLENLGETFGTVIPYVTWPAFTLGGGFTLGHTIGDTLNPSKDKQGMGPLAMKIGYVIGSGVGYAQINGLPNSVFKLMRDTGALSLTAILGYYRASNSDIPASYRKVILGVPAGMMLLGGAVEGVKSWRNR